MSQLDFYQCFNLRRIQRLSEPITCILSINNCFCMLALHFEVSFEFNSKLSRNENNCSDLRRCYLFTMCSIVVWIARVRTPSASLLQHNAQLIMCHLTTQDTCCDWLVFSSCDWRISILSVLLNAMQLHHQDNC